MSFLAFVLSILAAVQVSLISAAHVGLDSNGQSTSSYTSCLHNRGLVTHKMSSSDHSSSILKWNNVTCIQQFINNEKHTAHQRNFRNRISLAFVTPWNKNGYKWSELYAKKFTHISPVWFNIQMLPSSKSIMIVGGHDINYKWMKNIKESNGRLKILPRYQFDGQYWTAYEIDSFLKSKKRQTRFLSKLRMSMIKNGFKNKNENIAFDGCVFELTPFWNFIAHITQDFHKEKVSKGEYKKHQKRFLDFLQRIYKSLKKKSKQFFLVMSPFHLELLPLSKICKICHGIPIMTYDYSANIPSANDLFPISPLHWVQEIGESLVNNAQIKDRYHYKFLLGLNFYGYKYSGSVSDTGVHKYAQPNAFVGNELLQLLRNNSDVCEYEWIWNSKIDEHSYEAIDKSVVIYYPTLISIASRIQYASLNDFGISIWELGQGLEYFTDLL